MIPKPETAAPALVLATGALVGTLLSASESTVEYIIAAAVASATLLIFRRRQLAIALFAVVTLVFAGWTAYLRPQACTLGEGPVKICGTVESVGSSANSQRALVSTSSYGRILLTVIEMEPELLPGDIIEFTCEPLPVQRFADIPYMRMAAQTDRSRRISAEAVAEGTVNISVRSNRLIYKLSDLRSMLADAIYSSSLSPYASHLLATSTVASRELPADIREAFRASGLSHLLCVSGFHVGILAALIGAILLPLRLLRGQNELRWTLILLFVWLYALLTGAGPSVVRAAIMISVYGLARILQRRPKPFNTLCVAFCAVLAVDSYQLFSAGFQLSFSAVAGLLLFSEKLNPVSRRHRVAGGAVSLVATPAAALLGTLPVLIVWFGAAPLIGIPANALALLLFPVFIVTGTLSVILWHTGLPSGALIWLSDRLSDTIRVITDTSVQFSENTSLTIGAGTLGICMLIAALTAFAYTLYSPGRRLWGATAVVLCLLTTGCGETAGEYLVIDGDSRGCDICMVTKKGTIIIPSRDRHRPLTRCDRFFRAVGGDSIDFSESAVGRISFGNTVIMIASKNYLPDGKTDVLLVDGRCKGDAASVIASTRPGAIVLGADLPAEYRAEWYRVCTVPLTDLREKAFFYPLEVRR